MKKCIFLLSFTLLFNACSSKVQTNKIPNDKKYNLPLNSNYKEPKLDEMQKEKFNLALQDFFTPKEKIEDEANLWKMGMGYFQ